MGHCHDGKPSVAHPSVINPLPFAVQTGDGIILFRNGTVPYRPKKASGKRNGIIFRDTEMRVAVNQPTPGIAYIIRRIFRQALLLMER